jgi:hypothetical protein
VSARSATIAILSTSGGRRIQQPECQGHDLGEHYSSDLDFGHASRVAGAVDRQGENCVERLLDVLCKEDEDFETDPIT